MVSLMLLLVYLAVDYCYLDNILATEKPCEILS